MRILTATASTLLKERTRSLSILTQSSLWKTLIVEKKSQADASVWATNNHAKRSFASSKHDAHQEAVGGGGYLAQKKAAKERRRNLWESRQAHKERLKTRRSGKPRDEKRRQFRSWFIPKKVNEEYMNRKARQAGLDWKLQVAVIMERTPVVLPDKEDWEIEYENLKTHLFLYGKMYPKELFNIDYENREIAMTDDELLELLPKGYTPAPRETEADATGEVRTTDRKLKTSIYLAVLDEDGGQWQLPTVALKDDETLLDAAKRAVNEKVGSNVEFWCPSNAPWAVDMVALPEEERKDDGFYGTKKFFMKIQYDEGDVSEKEMTVKDFAWLDRGEIVERVKEEQGEEMSKFYYYML